MNIYKHINIAYHQLKMAHRVSKRKMISYTKQGIMCLSFVFLQHKQSKETHAVEQKESI